MATRHAFPSDSKRDYLLLLKGEGESVNIGSIIGVYMGIISGLF